MTSTGKHALLNWCKKVTRDYENVNMKDFSASWRDGLAFLAVLHRFHGESFVPGLKSLQPNQNEITNLTRAFDLMKKIGIELYLDPEDVLVGPRPEPLSMQTQVIQIYKYYKDKKVDNLLDSNDPPLPLDSAGKSIDSRNSSSTTYGGTREQNPLKKPIITRKITTTIIPKQKTQGTPSSSPSKESSVSMSPSFLKNQQQKDNQISSVASSDSKKFQNSKTNISSSVASGKERNNMGIASKSVSITNEQRDNDVDSKKVMELRSKIEDLRKQISNIEESKKQRIESIQKEHKNNMSDLNRKYNEEKESLKLMSTKEEKMKNQEKNDLEQKLKNVRNENRKLENQIQSHVSNVIVVKTVPKFKFSNLNSNVKKASQEIEDLDKQLSSARMKNCDLDFAIKKAQSEQQKAIEDAERESNREIEVLKDELKRAKMELERVKKNTANDNKYSGKTLEQYKVENNQLEKEKTELQKRYDSLMNQKKESPKPQMASTHVTPSSPSSLSGIARARNATIVNPDIMNLFRQEQIERFLLENCLISLSLEDFVNPIPDNVKIIYHCMKEWKSFEREHNLTFSTNLCRLLKYITEKTTGDILTQVFWIKFIYRLLEYVSMDYPREVQIALGVMRPYEKVFNFQHGFEISAPDPPIFISNADDNILESKKQTKGQCANRFVSDTIDVLHQVYNDVIEKAFGELETLISNAIFNPKGDGFIASEVVLTQLSNTMEDVENNHLDKRIHNHIFFSLAATIDTYIFNSMIRNCDTISQNRALNVKMFISSLENWFDENDIQKFKKSEEEKDGKNVKVSLFVLSRQIIDIFIIADASLLKDDKFRNQVVPNANVTQIAYVLKNMKVEDGIPDKSKIPKVTTPSRTNLKMLYIPVNIPFTVYFDSDLKDHVEGSVFFFGDRLKKDNKKALTIEVLPLKFTSRKELKFLTKHAKKIN